MSVLTLCVLVSGEPPFLAPASRQSAALDLSDDQLAEPGPSFAAWGRASQNEIQKAEVRLLRLKVRKMAKNARGITSDCMRLVWWPHWVL